MENSKYKKLLSLLENASFSKSLVGVSPSEIALFISNLKSELLLLESSYNELSAQNKELKEQNENLVLENLKLKADLKLK
ncbi:hypothetical protein ABC468_02135 [Mycoplasmopsis synoviae]|uniref:Uncharacterized protein n=1 Tax=Mycoplasmopsis synoviae TaxID=2109 RepID=A0A3B0PJ14_MYCSY|nr:hypothetical protein [Mycoplasmopsis synoviae]AKB11293.1 hypothetical protein VY93_03145 [Mycoplasmopsis synoviae ATCC 25204]UBM43550.1 hypothetical protein LA081_03115 [Mycoplasmopsis synoviae]SYV93484.1 Uncharacterised protein [Mycoplasmopsis synoviae]